MTAAGAPDRDRTCTPFRITDFKSVASTSSATGAARQAGLRRSVRDPCVALDRPGRCGWPNFPYSSFADRLRQYALATMHAIRTRRRRNHKSFWCMVAGTCGTGGLSRRLSTSLRFPSLGTPAHCRQGLPYSPTGAPQPRLPRSAVRHGTAKPAGPAGATPAGPLRLEMRKALLRCRAGGR